MHFLSNFSSLFEMISLDDFIKGEIKLNEGNTNHHDLFFHSVITIAIIRGKGDLDEGIFLVMRCHFGGKIGDNCTLYSCEASHWNYIIL